MHTETHSPALVAAALAYADALVAYNETMKYSEDRRAKNKAQDALFAAHEKLNEVAKENML